jgi:GNAT superfamily N-acetyltransferase
MYVDPEYRGGGVGSLLLTAVEEGAKALGYSELYLDTLARLESACALYKARGYEVMPPYNHTPVEDVLYFKKTLPLL